MKPDRLLRIIPLLYRISLLCQKKTVDNCNLKFQMSKVKLEFKFINLKFVI